MTDRLQQLRALFRATALPQLEQIVGAIAELRRGEGGPAAAGAIGPALHLLKGDATLVGLGEIAAALHAAEERAAEGAWDALAAELAVIAGALAGEDDAPAAPAPAPAPALAEPAALRRWVRLQTDEIDELSDRLHGLSTAYNRLADGLVRAVRDAPTEALRELAAEADAARLQLDEVLGAAWSLRLAPIEDLLHRLGEHAIELARSQGKPLRVRVDGGGAELERPTLEAIEEPLLHLIRNAIDHGVEAPGARGGKPAEPTLVLEARIAGDTIEIAVEDDGRGFDPAAARAAGAPRGAPARGARGVGLDAVRARIEGLGGTSTLSSRPGRGTRCVLAVPAPSARAPAVAPPPAPRAGRVVIADDSPLVLELVSSILRGAGLVPETAPDGEAAWRALEEELPALLLTDAEMPGLDGFELIRRVRARWPRLPVVMLTTRDTEPDRRRAMALGADAYLVKARLDERELVETIRRLIDEPS